ncbi:FK506-binding protein 5 [Pieris rapae]|uniref:FK506-binding protein 5 n=1 Tax=Pieris rapae TaxID=64459 RepID=UPI001E280FFD|nr:FK506-binding protein 5 [Pieris rapae]
MNSKKSKHKKPKSTNTSAVSALSEINKNLEETKIEEFVSHDNDTCSKNEKDLSVVLESENVCTEDAPIAPEKPKRKKGKKKREERASDILSVSEAPNNESDIFNEPEQTEANIDKGHEVIATRKKRKGKKNTNKTEEGFTDVTQSTPHVFVDASVSENISSSVKNATPIKKQKKKKEHSDKTELESCTSAFQKLLEPGECQLESDLSDNSFAEGLSQENMDKSNQLSGALQTGKKKKKNKKDKNKLVEAIATRNPSSVVMEENKIEKFEEITKLAIEDAKSKAVIAKPVDKKRKNRKCDNASSATDIEETISNNPIPEELNKIIKANKDADVSLLKSEAKHSMMDNENSGKQSEKNITLEVICNEQSTEQSCEDVQSDKTTEFTEARPRKKKRFGKHTDKENIKETEPSTDKELNKSDMKLNIASCSLQSDLKEEESHVTPDLIQYPRSSSQQQFDNNNNNMVIREINSPDQAQQGIPILMSVPIVEGSGESPEVVSKQDPLDLKVIELKTETLNNSDKGRPLKENVLIQEVQELKMTIEKSLAELTELERNDLEAEREFAEVLEYNLKDSTAMQEEKSLKEIILTTPCEINKTENIMLEEINIIPESVAAPVCPSRKDKKSKTKKKGKKTPEACSVTTTTTTTTSGINVSVSSSSKSAQETNKNENKNKKSDNQETKGKQQSTNLDKLDSQETLPASVLPALYEPIEKFEDALTSSTEDINDTFEMIAKEASELPIQKKLFQKPEISVTEPEEDAKAKPIKVNPASQPKNLLGHPNIPAQSNKTDYKKEKNKPPNTMTAKVKVRDANEIEKAQTKDSETKNNLLKQASKESYSYRTTENNDFVYKYSFRKVFLPNFCHVCTKELGSRVACKFCNLLFYCSQKHKDEDWPQHQFLCFVVCTMAHLKEQKFIYGDAKNITGQDYRVLRMQLIISCEKMLRRKLVPWEQEALLYPRICNNSACREWRQDLLTDCQECGQISYCTEHPEHLPLSHQRWCKSYALYQKLVSYQQKLGRLEPKLPTKVMPAEYQMPETMNEVLASLYEEKLDMNDVDYAAVTQIATAPLTAAFCYQTNGKNFGLKGLTKKSTLTIHIVGAELQFEADILNKWEVFFLHIHPDVKDLRVVLISRDLNPSNLPLDLLSKIKLCESCRLSSRRLLFKFIDKKTYQDYFNSDEFLKPDIVCSFNQSIERASIYNGRDHWPSTIKCISKLKTPLLITGYTLNELIRDISRVQKLSNFNVITEPKHNYFASIRPDRNFITDDEMPLLFKNYCYTIVCG